MKLGVYTIRDQKTGIHYPPQVCHNNAHAMRLFMQIFTAQNEFSKFPADYDVYGIGVYDEQTAELEAHKPEFVANGLELKNEYKRQNEGK